MSFSAFVLGLTFVFAQLTATAPTSPPDPASAVPAEIRTLLEAHDYPLALEAVRTALEASPRSPSLAALQIELLATMGRFDEIEAPAREALALDLEPRLRARILAACAESLLSQERTSDALTTADEAMRLAPDDRTVVAVAAMAAARYTNYPLATRRARRLATIDPQSPLPHTMLAQILATQNRFEEAQAEAAIARRLGAHEEVFDRIDARVRSDRRERLLWKLAGTLVAILPGGLLIMLAAGMLLSRLQLSRLGGVSPHLLRDEQTASERAVDRLYSATLWGASAMLFIAIPILFLLSAGVGLGGLYMVLVYAHRIDLRIIVLGLIVGIGGPWSIIRGLSVPTAPPVPGEELTEQSEPRLFETLREVAGFARARMVDRVVLQSGSIVAVTEEGGLFAVLFGRGKRVLILGQAALASVDVSEFKAIVAHEFGHFAHGETRLGPVIGRVQSTALQVGRRIASLGYAWANPAFWFLRAYIPLYIRITAGHSRRRELLADRTAAFAFGGDTFGRALATVVARGEFFDREVGNLLSRLRIAGWKPGDVYRLCDAAYEGLPEDVRAKSTDALLTREQRDHDTHPPPAERIRRVAGIEASQPHVADRATTLLADAAERARRASEEIWARVEEVVQLRLRYLPRPETLEDARVDTIAKVLARENLAIAQLEKTGGSVGVEELRRAIDELSGLVEPDDRLLVPSLLDLAECERRAGNVRESTSLLERTLAIVKHRDPMNDTLIAEIDERLGVARQALPAADAA